jgi:hypothetical protein
MIGEVIKVKGEWGFVQALPDGEKVQVSYFYHQANVVGRTILQLSDLVRFDTRDSVKKIGQVEACNIRLLKRGDDSDMSAVDEAAQ